MGCWREVEHSVRIVWTSFIAMSLRSARHKTKYAYRQSNTFHYHWGQFQAHTFHVVPSMGPIVSVINLQDQEQQNSLKKSRPVSQA